jgi:hypothetical protein
VCHVPLYRQESTTPELKKHRTLVFKWEDILSRYGLADGQLSQQDVQHTILPPKECRRDGAFPIDNDPELKPDAPWVDEGNHEVERKFTNRDVPFWALSDNNIAAFLRHRHTSLDLSGTEASHKKRNRQAREAAARTVAHIYLAWRAGWQNYDIANLLGTTEGNVDKFLGRIKEEAEEFFARHAPRKDVLVHNCHTVGDPQLRKCRCKLYVSHADAKDQVRQGLAEWMQVYPPNGKPYLSHGAIVAVRGKRTPRAAMLEKAHMERNAGGQEEQQASVEAFGVLEYLFLASLISKEIKADAFPGMPVLPIWIDERGGK